MPENEARDHRANRCPACASTFLQPVRPGRWSAFCHRFSRKIYLQCWHCAWTGWLRPLPGDPGGPSVNGDRSEPHPRNGAPHDSTRPSSAA